mmetsp:Transcript_314/g.961  ORF Transcript_314/g.961 Transcript_314/m.961 type:complete len:363 (-) Transcript_314:169-1257(-)
MVVRRAGTRDWLVTVKGTTVSSPNRSTNFGGSVSVSNGCRGNTSATSSGLSCSNACSSCSPVVVPRPAGTTLPVTMSTCCTPLADPMPTRTPQMPTVHGRSSSRVTVCETVAKGGRSSGDGTAATGLPDAAPAPSAGRSLVSTTHVTVSRYSETGKGFVSVTDTCSCSPTAWALDDRVLEEAAARAAARARSKGEVMKTRSASRCRSSRSRSRSPCRSIPTSARPGGGATIDTPSSVGSPRAPRGASTSTCDSASVSAASVPRSSASSVSAASVDTRHGGNASRRSVSNASEAVASLSPAACAMSRRVCSAASVALGQAGAVVCQSDGFVGMSWAASCGASSASAPDARSSAVARVVAASVA